MRKISEWDKEYKKSGKLWGRCADKELLNLSKKLKKDSKILDIGCGDGRNLIPLCRKGFFVNGLDISKQALNKCKERLRGYKLNNFKLKKGNALKTDYKNNSFDLVILSTVLRAFKGKEISIVFREIHRMLRKNGILFFKDSKYDIINGKKIIYFTEKQIKNLLKKYYILTFKVAKTYHKGHKGVKNYSKEHIHYWIIAIARRK